ncbi:hypothetical protein K0M31_012565, partial [Melipona bicolor]
MPASILDTALKRQRHREERRKKSNVTHRCKTGESVDDTLESQLRSLDYCRKKRWKRWEEEGESKG